MIGCMANGKACDDGDSRFLPIDLLKNLDNIENVEVQFQPQSDFLKLSKRNALN